MRDFALLVFILFMVALVGVIIFGAWLVQPWLGIACTITFVFGWWFSAWLRRRQQAREIIQWVREGRK